MKNLLLFFFIITTANIFSQNLKNDSLNKNVIETYKKHLDSIRHENNSDYNYFISPEELDSIVNKNKYYPNYSEQQYQHSLYLSISILIFGGIIIGGIFYILIKQKKGWGPNTVQIVSITLLIVAGLFLITAGYSQQQITPIVGLLGTISGYLLGKSSKG
ncbi:hypothetical protein PQ462_06615 [Flavobacterium sp. KACC 22758]|uniref:hypothetical protein n=1 Tax=Flavobacterium sp. KACC 22758 TaxID=3025667 RepID=UPI00236618E8|nr:hypothetical protein [Flavobacterium sp. KACC 22758]WDF61033.1 hypothetical protein PQ462_06615 [Flavobacterium sp. KACC 22758]